MEIPYSEKFEIQVPALPGADLNPLPAATDIYSLALQTQPSIKSSELQKKIEQSGLEIVRAGLYPKLSLNAGLNSNYSSLSKLSRITTTSTMQTIGYLKNDPNMEVVNYVERNLYTSSGYPFFQQLSDRFNQFVSLNLSIPIFNGKETRYAIRKQEINIKAAELNDRINKNNLRKTIEQATVDASNAQMKYISAQEALNAEEITYQNLQLLFEASKTTAIELLVEKNKLAVSNSQLLQAKYDLVLRLKVLDYYEGKPLNLR
jgi:outer membrane protein